MTDAAYAVQDPCPTQTDQANKLELLGQGAITLHWDDIEDAIRASIKDTTELSLSRAAGDIRKGIIKVFGVWRDGKRRGLILARPVNDGYSGHALLVYAMHGEGLKLDEWQDVAGQLADSAAAAGFRRIVALTDNERVLAIVRYAGWTVSNYCWKEI